MRFEIRKSNDPRQPYYWRMVATNGQVLAHSENYTSVQGCRNAIDVVKRQAANAPVHDYTMAA